LNETVTTGNWPWWLIESGAGNVSIRLNEPMGTLPPPGVPAGTAPPDETALLDAAEAPAGASGLKVLPGEAAADEPLPAGAVEAEAGAPDAPDAPDGRR
jgi:hypothetical protein